MEQKLSAAVSFPRLANYIWQAPLVPVAIALTIGILLDRFLTFSLVFELVAAVAALAAWMINYRSHRRLALAYLWVACAGFGAVYHHVARAGSADNDIRYLATEEAKPVRLKGDVASEPNFVQRSKESPLRSFPGTDATRFVLRVTHLKTAYDWLEVTGQAQVTLEAKIHPVHVGDSVMIVGRMSLPAPPANPGEFDYRAFLDDQGIGVVVSVPASNESIQLLAEGWPRSLQGWLAVTRGWGHDVFARHLPEKIAQIAGALVLGEGSGMTSDDWEKYARTGVIHVLAISGQHLVILSCFLWLFIRLFGVSSRRGGLFIAVFLLLYALLTGGRPPAMRSAWAMAIICGGLWIQRPTLPANAFALGWIGVILASPMDIFNVGCQLSFLAVAVLIWGISRVGYDSDRGGWLHRFSLLGAKPGIDPNLQKLIDESRPLVLQYLIRCGRWLIELYFINAAVWLAVAPLVASTQHLVSPVALLIGPPLVLLTSVALLAGFLTLLAAPLGLASIFAVPVYWSIASCEFLVDVGATLPGAFFYVPDIPGWWLCIFYLGVFAFLTLGWCRLHPKVFLGFAALWLAMGIVQLFGVFRSFEFRCTFLAVGHGGCTVLETEDGRVLVYDAGAIGGPELTRRQIAPYLWQRGISRIDELMISHADLDHFNGVTALLERFAVGRVTLTPSFSERVGPAVEMTLAQLQKRGIPTRIVKAGDQIDEGKLSGQILHPPLVGPEGNENARSLVLLLHKENLSILLTGDLEGPGLQRVLAMPPVKVDVLMAPHHGSKTSNIPALARWAKPKAVISSQGPPRGDPKTANPYETLGAGYFTTWKNGAVTIRKMAGDWTIESYRSGTKFLLAEFFP